VTTSSTPDAAAAPRLRPFLSEAGYTGDGVGRALGESDKLPSSPVELAVHLRRLEAKPGPLATLVRLFVLGVPVDVEDADRDLAPLGLDAFVEAGLVAADRQATALAKLAPLDDLLIASDLGGSERADLVAGIHRPSATLSHLTVRRPVTRALDVGTGNGIQALLLAAHAEHVVATDVNERALAFAEFNAALNGVANVEFRAGSFLEPVEGERFGVVAANPPYVVSPESEYLFRDSGLGRDRVSENLVRALPDVLEDGAFATVMVSWIQEGDEPAARPLAWVEGSGCDALVLHSATDDALTSAAAWNRDAPDDEFVTRFERWADYYRDEGIEALGYGAIVLRRRAGGGETWTHSLRLPEGSVRPAAEHVERLFAAQDLLAEGPPPLDRAYAFVPGARLDQQLAPGESRWEGSAASLVLEDGLAFRVGLDAPTARTVAAIGEGRPLGETFDELAPELDVSPEAMRRAGAGVVAQLLELGFLFPR